MSRRGAKPKPTKLKALSGTLRSDRLNPHEPETRPAVPRCPEHLGPEAKREWRRLAPQLARMGLLCKIDRAALALFCQAWARWIDAEEAPATPVRPPERTLPWPSGWRQPCSPSPPAPGTPGGGG